MKMMKDEISIPRQIDLKLYLPLLVPKEKEKNRTIKRHTQYNCCISMIGKDK